MSREKFNLSSKNYYSQKENHQQVYVWHISSLWTGVEEQLCNQKEKEKYEDIEKLSVFCFNRKQIKDLQTSFGKLHRVGTEQGSTAKPVYFMPEASGLVGSKGLGGSLLMIVDTFVSESVRCNIASSIRYDLDINGADPERLDNFYECVVEFGFDHIIVLYPLGNSLEDVKSRLKQKNQVIWIAEDGVVYEEPSDMYAYKHYYNESEDML
ncbi:unnamed protein product [Rhizophagus irregularis]|uniref:Uncharacterized protein n=1 Tax=Rhizophagus irregularis TaxID=588596 RepID=A0A915ZSU9_9GLOM|nr:unnamed protein product [Rhizophagus irregularis]CAB5389549.1 unnamed protein product [Rhizophagus irregularis]